MAVTKKAAGSTAAVAALVAAFLMPHEGMRDQAIVTPSGSGLFATAKRRGYTLVNA